MRKPKIIRAWITATKTFVSPIDGLSVSHESGGELKGFCAAFGLKFAPGETFTIHIELSSCVTYHIPGMGLKQFRTMLDELANRGLDLFKVIGMERRFLLPNTTGEKS